MRKMTPMTPNENSDNRFARSSMANCSGVRCSSTCWSALYLRYHHALTSCIISKTTPNSVSFPVPTTIPDPCPTLSAESIILVETNIPLLTRVPMKAIQCLSPSAFPPPSPCVSSPSPLSHIWVFFLLGRVSPVKADSSISRATEVIKRMSAGIRSPTEKVTRSPGRRAFASGARDCPFLVTLVDLCMHFQVGLPYQVAVMRNKLIVN
jgi:hypothetical protein